jgi:AsmA protein
MQFDKRAVKITGIVIAVVVVILIALPLFINVDSFRPKIESALTYATGRQVSLGKLGLSVMSGKVSVDDVTIADDPDFSKSSFITAKVVGSRGRVDAAHFLQAVERDGHRPG